MGKSKGTRGHKSEGRGGGGGGKDKDKDDGPNISKSTNKVVTQMRIREIEKNVRSMSSILDNRTLFDIENVNKVDTASKKLTEAGKRSATNRRDNNTVQAAILNQGLLAAAALRTEGIKMANTTEEYGNEESIWKHKYRTPSYTQKRRFNNPKLHDYYKSLNGEEQKDFRQQCRDSLYAVSTNMRESVADHKSKMDERGIFHPAANAHRAHCSYLLKVYKEVDAAKIEDPVLRSMRLKDKYAERDDVVFPGTPGGDSSVADSTMIESVPRGPVFRATQSSQSKIRPAKNPRIFEKKVEKKSLSSMFDMVKLPMDESGGGAGGKEGGGSPTHAARMSEDVEGGGHVHSASNTVPNSGCNTPAPNNKSRQNSMYQNKDSSAPNNKSRQNSMYQNKDRERDKERESKEKDSSEASSSRGASRAATPSREKMTEQSNAEGGGGGRGGVSRGGRSASGKFKTEEGGNMEGFTDSHTTDWMIGRLQKEQMAAVVNSSGQQISVPLGRDGELSWKSLPELQMPSGGNGGGQGDSSSPPRPQSPVISFTQFNDLFKSYNDQVTADLKAQADAEEQAALHWSDEGPEGAGGIGGSMKDLFVNTKFDSAGARDSDGGDQNNSNTNNYNSGTPKNSNHNLHHKGSMPLPSISPSTIVSPTHGGGLQRKGSGHNHISPSKGGGGGGGVGGKRHSRNAVGGGGGDESQRIMDTMQPHLDAFVAVNVSKKSNNIQMVQKMLSGIKKTPGGGVMPRAATADARMSRRPGGVSEVGKVAVQTLKNNNRVGRVYGFRNVFLQPESDDDDSDDESDTSESCDIQSSSSEDSSEYDSDEETQAVEVKRGRGQEDRGGGGAGKLSKKRTEKKIKTEDSSVIQERQMAIWDVLEIRTEDRVKLMNKYSSDEHSDEFKAYLSVWAQVALLVLFRQELKKVFLWYQRGLLSVPLDNPEGSQWVFLELLRRTPPLLKGSYSAANRNKKSLRAEPSYSVLEKARGFLTFEEDEQQQLGFQYPRSILPFLHSTVKHFDRLLLEKLNEAEAALEDVIPFGAGSCKEWLMSKAQKFPVPKI